MWRKDALRAPQIFSPNISWHLPVQREFCEGRKRESSKIVPKKHRPLEDEARMIEGTALGALPQANWRLAEEMRCESILRKRIFMASIICNFQNKSELISTESKVIYSPSRISLEDNGICNTFEIQNPTTASTKCHDQPYYLERTKEAVRHLQCTAIIFWLSHLSFPSKNIYVKHNKNTGKKQRVP